MDTIEHVGTVVEIQDDRAVVELRSEEACGRRDSCGCCGAAAGPRRVRVDANDLQVGDAVEVSVPASSGYLSAFFVFVVPLLGFIGGMVAGAQFEFENTGNDLTALFGGVLGVGLGILIAVIANRAMSGPENRPKARPLSEA